VDSHCFPCAAAEWVRSVSVCRASTVLPPNTATHATNATNPELTRSAISTSVVERSPISPCFNYSEGRKSCDAPSTCKQSTRTAAADATGGVEHHGHRRGCVGRRRRCAGCRAGEHDGYATAAPCVNVAMGVPPPARAFRATNPRRGPTVEGDGCLRRGHAMGDSNVISDAMFSTHTRGTALRVTLLRIWPRARGDPRSAAEPSWVGLGSHPTMQMCWWCCFCNPEPSAATRKRREGAGA
jgi:hypothetical protein